MPKKILYVEDDEDTRNLVRMILRSKGYKVVTAYNGREGLKKLEEDGIDLVILDIMLPDMSGWDIFQKIKKDPGNRGVKVAFLSVIPVSEERLDTLKKSGIEDYITKPFDNDDLVRRVGRILGE
ncbi:MAG: two-component system response regulator [Candidatus Altiarchaeales archaeon]|nr:MAG: two-component system response regulator [Candidatus Altiarchaeales archaeon]